MTNRAILSAFVIVGFSSVTANAQNVSSAARGQETDNRERLFAQELSCPEGTTVDPYDSTVSRLVCDIDSNDGEVFPLTDEEPTVVRMEDIPARINTSYPEWYTRNGGSGLANENSFHYYHTLMAPGAQAPAYDSDNIVCSSFFLRPGKTYFAHNHPSREFYYIYGGEGRWYGGDFSEDVGAGTLIVHPPYISHGFTNTSETEELSAFVCWWQTSEDAEDSLDHGGLPTNPCLVQSETTAKPYAVDSVCENE